jgi:UDP-GlcNAc:undecaprenyl-phosphate GlcNAc-1-phosphate transferase
MDLVTPVLAALVAFALALLATGGAARLGGRLGMLDVPSARSSHRAPVPRSGGVGILAALALAAAAFAAFGGATGGWAAWAPYAVPAVLYFGVGFADDVRRLGAGRKFLLQAIAAALAVALGLRWGGRELGPFGAMEFGAATPFMTWLWLVAVVIVVNFVDGIDLITAATCAVVLAAGAGGRAGPGEGALFAAAAGATLGFAAWNATPARVFAGDAGTHLLGFLVAATACGAPDAGAGAPHGLPWAAVGAPLLPGVLDVGIGIASKWRRGVPLVAAHNDHPYQRLAKAGRSHATVALRYGALAAVGVLLAARVAPDLGLLPCAAASLAILAWHLGTAVAPRAPRPTVSS